MKRQDISGENTLHVDGGGGGATSDVNITEVGGTPVTSPLPVSFSGNVTVVQPTGTNLHVVTDATSTTIATQATGTNLHTVVDSGTITTVSTVTAVTDASVQGKAASGASKSGNPVQVGAVFNTTQPTVTTGQIVEAQATARGALIVATGTDTFTATVNAGTNLNTSSLALDASVTAMKVAVTVVALQVTASGDTVLVASGTHKIRRVEMSNSSTTAAVTAGLKIASVNSGNTFSKKYLPAAGGQAVLMFSQNYLQCTSETISVNLSGTGQVECTIYYE